jgi:hypothetical protein
MARDPETRFWQRVDASGDCWVWLGGLNDGGYGRFYLDRKCHPAHRFAWTVLVGPIADGLVIDHLCRNRVCVNPDHLEPVTHRENILRGVCPAAKFAAATKCVNGHDFDAKNTYRFPGRGNRDCRECRRQRARAKWAKRRAS